MRVAIIISIVFAAIALALPLDDPELQSRNPIVGYVDYYGCDTIVCSTNDPCQARGCQDCTGSIGNPGRCTG